ncbi:hypothetical protein BZG36_03002 [Bifiguratus adelaidae]|uniref:Anaphase-promoting complex subunit 4 WD40 domain-containing protein n=1 Tax=Bifiguratus adelaidae TaxID=1938954 RepID=A0A261XZV7_9FUNG|nr:hypothetical protein BZG36_03002 [Bifiguratus adelaidae]
MDKPVVLTPPILSSFRITKIFKENINSITSLCYDDTGEICVTAAKDESLRVYDCRSGQPRNTLFSKKYGVHLAKFTHRQNNVVYASTKEDDTLRYLSLHDNKYIRYFRGHKKRVTALEMSPADDQFLSASLDNTVRLWDLRSNTCQGMINTPGRTNIAFDQAGLIFALGVGSTLKLYDLKAFDSGPFASWDLIDPNRPQGMAEWTSVQFSNDGLHILITTAGDTHYLVDAFDGKLEQTFVGHSGVGIGSNLGGQVDVVGGGGEACFTPDAQFVMAGSRDGKICLWDIAHPKPDHQPFHVLDGPTEPVSVLGINPKYLMLASGSSELCFWEPNPSLLNVQ